ncbi:hypothetical protein ACTXOR_05190 [Arthrobacter rhombi]|uniref:hypothetical protein n=1 Tax=Arthrobacter rhombi TaxID=71253 RepID=UPI003FD14875
MAFAGIFGTGQFLAGPSELAAIGVGDADFVVGETSVLRPLLPVDGEAGDEDDLASLEIVDSAPFEGEQALRAMAMAAPTANLLSAFLAIVTGMRPPGSTMKTGVKAP